MLRAYRSRFLTPTFALVFVAPIVALATTYDVPPDFEVVCLDLATGTVLWRNRPDTLFEPWITAGAGVVAADPSPSDPLGDDARYFDANTGGALDKAAFDRASKVPLTDPVRELPRNLKTTDGVELDYRQGDTRHLVSKGTGKVLTRLDWFPHDLSVEGDLAVFSFAGGVSMRDTGGGEVIAHDLKQRRLAWLFEASRLAPDIPERALTELALDSRRVLVSVDQGVYALDLDTGALLWSTKLPRQEIRPWDNPWTTFGRLGDRLFIRCYEDLFVLDAASGALLWSFDAGPFAHPWPTVAEGKVYVSARDGPVTVLSTSSPGAFKTTPSALAVIRDPSSKAGYRFELTSVRRVPAGEELWWSMHQGSGAQTGSKRVKVWIGSSDSALGIDVDVTEPLARKGRAYVKLNNCQDLVKLFSGEKKLLELDVLAAQRE